MQSISKVCLRNLWKWMWNMWKIFLESSTSIWRRTKEISSYWMILWMKLQRASKLPNFFTRGCHDNLSVIYLTWNLFHKNQHVLNLNWYYITICKNPRNKSQFATIARKMRPDKVKFFMWTCKDVRPSLHSYLMLDLKQSTEERFRAQSNILKDPQHVDITYWKRKRIICNLTMGLSACLRTLRSICLCW